MDRIVTKIIQKSSGIGWKPGANPRPLLEASNLLARRMNSADWSEATTSFPENPTDIIPYTRELNIFYTICESLVALFAVVGNAIVIIVFRKERKLRRRTNYYIVSLAAADLLVGLLGIPFAILASVGLPTNLHACLFTVSLLLVLCTISIFCLVAVSVDRYWAILHPMGYSRHVRTKTALGKFLKVLNVGIPIVKHITLEFKLNYSVQWVVGR